MEIFYNIYPKDFMNCQKQIEKIDNCFESASLGCVNIMKDSKVIALIKWKRGNKIILKSFSRSKEDRDRLNDNLEYCDAKFKKFNNLCLKSSQSI